MNRPRMASPLPAGDAPEPAGMFRVDQLPVRVYRTVDDLARAAAGAAGAVLQRALAERSTAVAIVASAASQIVFLRRLTELPGIDWSRVVLFHMDEYLGITAEHPASFRRFLRERVEAVVRPRTFHYLAGEADQPIRECDRYANLLRAQPIDLCCLGIGENGHVAFNDPSVADFDDSRWVKLVRLDEACRRQQVGEGAFPNVESVPQFAYTLTIPALCSAGSLIGVVPESRKASAVERALCGPIEVACPASVLRRQAQATLYLDSESAAGIRGPAPIPRSG
jgi:glucosamine-6-phosphate deaminase